MNLIVVGCGRQGSGLARSLSLAGHAVCVIDPDADALARLGPGFTGRKVHGDARHRQVLDRADVSDADGLAAVTGSDDINAALSRLAAQELGVPRVVARIYDPDRTAVFNRLGVQSVAPVTWGVERISELLVASDLAPVASLGAGQVELVDAAVPTLLDGRAVGELQLPGESRVAAITREGSTFVPPSDDVVLRVHDVVHLAVATSSASRVATILGRR